MLHKVKLAHFVAFGEEQRLRAAFTEVIVDAVDGDSAAQLALDTNRHLAFPRGPQQETKMGVCGIDMPTAEERATWEAGRPLGSEVRSATGHTDEFQSQGGQQPPAPTEEEIKAAKLAARIAKAKATRAANKAAKQQAA